MAGRLDLVLLHFQGDFCAARTCQNPALLLKFAAAFEGKTDAELIQAFKGKYLQEVHVASKSPCAMPSPDGLDNSDPRFLCMRPPLCSSRDRHRWRWCAGQQGARAGWLKATGEELTPEQAQALIDEVDEDKNGTLDQDEFVALIRKRCEQPLRSYADQFSNEQLIQIFESTGAAGDKPFPLRLIPGRVQSPPFP